MALAIGIAAAAATVAAATSAAAENVTITRKLVATADEAIEMGKIGPTV